MLKSKSKSDTWQIKNKRQDKPTTGEICNVNVTDICNDTYAFTVLM